jgi:Mn-dependent DtxR family transcriptional regulator
MLSGKKAGSGSLTPSHEHYLRALWEVRDRLGYARLTDVARELAVAPATLSVGLRPLEARGLIAHDEHRFLVLTPEGERAALEVHHRYHVLRAFLGDVLGIPADRAELEACRIEHELSPETTERLVDLIRWMREDEEVREVFARRFRSYHRACGPSDACGICGLSCLTDPPRLDPGTGHGERP